MTTNSEGYFAVVEIAVNFRGAVLEAGDGLAEFAYFSFVEYPEDLLLTRSGLGKNRSHW